MSREKPITIRDVQQALCEAAPLPTGLVFKTVPLSGTFLRARLDDHDFPQRKLQALGGATNSTGYYEPERGYDGWGISGTYKGERFAIYTRWHQLHLGGSEGLDVKGLITALRAAMMVREGFDGSWNKARSYQAPVEPSGPTHFYACASSSCHQYNVKYDKGIPPERWKSIMGDMPKCEGCGKPMKYVGTK